MATSFAISIDLGELLRAIPAVDALVFPMLRQAVEAMAKKAVADWKEAVYRAKLWEGEKTPYYESISYVMTGDFSSEVFTEYKLAEEIENGRPMRDLKRMLDTSPKVRISKKGRRYMIIPFRHNVPGASATGLPMPSSIYADAKALTASSIVGQRMRKSGLNASDIQTRQPMAVRARKYLWGGALPAGLAPKMRTSHATDIYAGMRRFDTSSGKSKRSSYMTFRVMSEISTGWIIAPRPGLHLAKGVADALTPKAEAAFNEAMRRELDIA